MIFRAAESVLFFPAYFVTGFALCKCLRLTMFCYLCCQVFLFAIMITEFSEVVDTLPHRSPCFEGCDFGVTVLVVRLTSILLVSAVLRKLYLAIDTKHVQVAGTVQVFRPSLQSTLREQTNSNLV